MGYPTFYKRGHEVSICKLVVLVLLALASCSKAEPTQALGSADYEIYSLVINQTLLDKEPNKGNSQRVVVEKSTSMELHYLIEKLMMKDEDPWGPALKTIKTVIPDAAPDTLKNFKTANATQLQLEKRLTLHTDYELGLPQPEASS